MRVLVSFLGPVSEEEVISRVPAEVTVIQVFPDLGEALVDVPEGFDLNRIRTQAGIIGAEEEQEFELFSPDINRNTGGDAGQGNGGTVELGQQAVNEEVVTRPTLIIPGFDESVEVAPSEAVGTLGLNDVLNDVGAPEAWNRFNRGEGAVVAVIDSGVCGEFFPEEKRAGGLDTTGEGDPWSDGLGHGSMVATIAAGDQDVGNPFNGIAPKAKIFSAKIFDRDGLTKTSRILEAVQAVIDFTRESQIPVVVNNSWGNPACSEGRLPSCGGYSVGNGLRVLTREGSPVTFAAGNEAERCEAQECGENTIWLQNSIDEVLSVATLDEDLEVRSYSSRGPGQCATINRKPDIAAPTYGSAVWDCETRNFSRGWGTSGASPVIAGILALMMTERPGLSVQQYHDAIRRSSGQDWNACTGHGLVNTSAALTEVGAGTVPEGATSPFAAALVLGGLGLLVTGIEE